MSGVGARALAAAVLAAAVAVPGAAAAEDLPLLAVGPVKDARPALVRQLRRAICAAVECVPWGTVSDGPGVDVAALRAAGVHGALVGAAEGAGRRALELSLVAVRGAPVARWRLGLDGAGTLSGRDARRLAGEIARRLRRVAGRAADGTRAVAPPPATDARGAAAAPRPSLEVLRAGRDPSPDPAGREGAPAPPPSVAPAGEEEGASAPPRRSAPWLGVEAGALLARRELSFPDAAPGPGPLRGHRVPGVVAPDLRLELQPAAWWTDGALAGVSLHVRGAAAVGAVTDVDGVAHRTRMTWLSAGVGWRSAPPAAARRSFAVGLSWERRDVAVTPAVPGLADRRLSGARASATLAAPVGPVSAFVRGGFVRWLAAPDLIGGRGRFFRGGGAWGIDAEAGLAVRVGGGWSLWLAGEYAFTQYQLDRDPQGIYAATSAQDEQGAARLAVRVDL